MPLDFSRFFESWLDFDRPAVGVTHVHIALMNIITSLAACIGIELALGQNALDGQMTEP